MAAQFTATNALCWRRPCPCSARATSSLPVPVWPRMRTVALPSAARPMVFCTRRIASLAPMRPPPGSVPLVEGAGPRCANIPSRTDFSSSRPIGLVR
jgi:hypothetical protein